MTTPNRTFLRQALAAGLDCGTVSPEDVLRHATADVLAGSLPADQKAKLLAASLAATAMTPALVVETLTVEILAEHIPEPVLWACLAEAAERSLSDAKATEERGAKPSENRTPVAKPNVSKVPAPPVAPSRKPTSPPVRAAGSAPRPAPPASRRQPRTPHSEFEVDTDVGDWPASRGSTAEAAALGASTDALDNDLGDWQRDEETKNLDVGKR
jgi:hypothetical protein